MRWILGLWMVWGTGCDDTSTADGDAGAAPPAGDTYVAGLERAGAAGALSVRLMEARPAPPELGDNLWRLEVVDSEGVVKTGCALTVAPLMPVHGHGTNRPAVITEDAAIYEVTPLDLFMPGLWEVPFTITCDDVVDQVQFEFWIEG